MLTIIFSSVSFTQVKDRFSFLNSTEVGKYAKPFATTLGTSLNSGSYHTAYVSKLFGFALSFRGMMVIVPDDQKTFVPSLPAGYKADKSTATIYGNKDGGAVYAGPDGYIIYPGGIEESNLPVIFPQVSVSLLGSEALIRYLPSIKIGETDVSLFGVGLKHSVSQYFILLPVDIAVQVLYNSFKVKDLMDVSNFAVNAHVSKTFGALTAYGGVQYENTKFDLSYTIKGDPNSGDPELRKNVDIKTSVDGDNKVRMTLGASVKFAVFVFNADYNIGSQSAFTGGLSFEF
jgi:hypothetical protein